eukprot:TRINITY_DN234_c1_g1_i5.p1 TRINITY_DN234_c1_g1~~TRINITY_DN234_c1_g1_i5.p1  ORF type:complete len:659 (+),score=196.41 TRINITY_DN234_c1_g1_i5:46-2022(+)
MTPTNDSKATVSVLYCNTIKMRTLTLAACLATATAAVHTAPFVPNEEMFRDWLAEGGETIYNPSSFPEVRLKVAKRIAQMASDTLKDQASMYNLMSWFGRGSGIDATTLAADLERLGESESLDGFVRVSKEVADSHYAALNRKQEEGAPYRPLGKNEYPYWNFIPSIPGAAKDGETFTFTNEGCKQNVVSAARNGSELVITFKGDDCSPIHSGDVYLLTTVKGVHFMKVGFLEKEHEIRWSMANLTQAEAYDITTKGVRVFAFPHDEVELVVNILATVNLFLQPEAGKYPDFPDKEVEKANVDFLTKYQKVQPLMVPRGPINESNPTNVDPDLIQTGDFIGVIRLDGLDPMLAWAMGSTTGHTTIAVRDATTNELFVCESTTNSSYWPTNGVQKTPYTTWIKQAEAAGYNAVWAPLDPAQRAKLNVTAMWEFFSTVEGLQYGYHTLLWGWIDTVADNYPCVAPDYKHCLQWGHVEVLFPLVSAVVPAVGELIFNEAWNFRLNTTGLNAPEMYMHAETVLNISSNTIPTIVERDEWMYHTTRYGKPVVGKSMVCCVFVCNMWKHGGLFGDTDFNCGEMTNLDDYDLDIFDKTKMNDGRPDVCKQKDPNNQNCQLVGPYTLNFNHYNEAPIYDHMAEKCPTWTPGVGPNYWGPGKQQGTC